MPPERYRGMPAVGRPSSLCIDRVSAAHIDVDGLVGHRCYEVVVRPGYTGVGARERMARPNRVDRALVYLRGADAIHDDLEALRLQLADRGIDGRRAGRGGVRDSGQSQRR